MNVGCIPTKTQVGSAKAIQIARRGEEFGFHISGLEVDWPRIRARKDAIVSSIVKGIERSLEQNPRIDLFRGTARFVGPGRLSVDGRDIEAEKVIVASGVVPVVPDIPGLAEAGFKTNETVMDMEKLPRSMLVIGGGPEGMEFSQIFHRFGVKVTVLQRRDRVLPREDEEISRELEAILREEGIDIRTRATPKRVEKLAGDRSAVIADIAGKEMRFECDRILVAAGRRPHQLAEMGLDAVGVEGDPLRGIAIDETLRTTAPNVWAVGDVMGRMQYTHFAVYTAGIAVANALKGGDRTYDTLRIPGAVFTDPEVASVGLTEQEALARGRKIKVGKQAMKAVGRARAMGETAGFVKFVVDAQTDELLGMHVLAHLGADLLPQGILLLHTAERSIAPLTHCICVHPTLSEGVKAAVTNLKPVEAVLTATGDLEG
ncbi:MAG: FAD-dependent oxidoreductase [Chloroflexi bacterium]|nr:FAD-dependent oxidoreductase [Chloroflexota bacterium]